MTQPQRLTMAFTGVCIVILLLFVPWAAYIVPRSVPDAWKEIILAASTPVMMILFVGIPLLGSKETVLFRKPVLKDLFFVLPMPLLAAGVVLLNWALCNLMYYLKIPPVEQDILQMLSGSSGLHRALLIFCTVVAAPVTEELGYRYVFFRFLRDLTPGGKITAALVTSLVFALSHGLLQQTVGLFLTGIIFQMGAWRDEDGITRSALMHAAYNLSCVTGLFLFCGRS